MSTSANLPAGFSLTTVNGQKCTAIPKIAQAGGDSTTSVAVASTTAAATTTSISTTAQTTVLSTSLPPVSVPTSSTPPPAAASSTIVQTSAAPIITPPSSTPIVNAPPTTSAASLALTTSIPPVVAPSTAAKTSPVVTTSAISSSNPFSISSIVGSSSLVAISASPASRGTTPTESSGTPLAIAQSEVSATPTLSSLARTTLSSARATNPAASNSVISSVPSSSSSTTSSEASKESTDGGIASSPRMTAGPVVGGVLGSMAFIAGLAFLIFFCIKRRKRRESLLTPLGTGTRTEFYRDEKVGGPMSTFDNDNDERWSKTDRLKATAAGLQMGLIGLGAKLKKTVVRDRSDSPSVNLNRGNSQFLDGPIPQHSRNNSVFSTKGEKPGAKERFTEWWTKFKKLHMPMLSEPEDPFTAARVANEKQAQLNNPTPDFSQLLGMDDRELQLQAERRRENTRVESASSLPPLGSLGLSFKGLQDPFADPTKPAYDSRANPFADPITQPQAAVPKQNTYVADVRRSRGASIGANNLAPSGPVSRYPSSVAPSRDSYRDTVFSAFSSNARKGKGRSDPFDLERPELWRRTNNQNFESPAVTGHSRAPSLSGGDSSVNLYPAPINTSNAANQNPQSGYGQPRLNSPVEQRVTSSGTYESKYSSGVSSLGGWGDPGPDLGPGSSSSSLKSTTSSKGGVGKAM